MTTLDALHFAWTALLIGWTLRLTWAEGVEIAALRRDRRALRALVVEQLRRLRLPVEPSEVGEDSENRDGDHGL